MEHDVDRDVYLGDLPSGVSEDEVERILDRRVFAMPHRGTVIGGEEFDRLDPADPDERSLLIQGEHPEFQQYLADSTWQGEIDGMNPRFHLTMHEVIANQLWADEPPEVWRAAKRLREQGMARHDVLHELARVMAEHMRPTLTRGEPFDEDSYRGALADL
ncbi:DUF1841 family protein [Actinophytocola algeriensis]|uniref:DUF1841 family protein n=1 Tax=Actinophytocola algeriensis TaxID=1768010 RepID=A0A7W7Q4U8_9PSEU|nr:DUF1841 family protein [Actinophytocola algeriensis]MBB4907014.1 hypothetical protein [Actinophytocola algeriensis]MBE1478497.1 hypothetical protein [Actinophytocola algeriensis]